MATCAPMDEKIRRLSWVSMVDRVYGKVDQFFREIAITDNEWRWAEQQHPEFFSRIRALEEEANPQAMDKEAFWNLLDRWGKNHLFLFGQIKRARSEGIPEVSQEDVDRAAAAERDKIRGGDIRPGAGPKPRAKHKAKGRAAKAT